MNNVDIVSGDIVYMDQIEFDPPNMLAKAHSTYGYGSNIEFEPDSKARYIICNGNENDGFLLKKLDEINLNIGFCVKKYNDEYYFQVTQHGCDMKKINITKISHSDTYPEVHRIGSQIFICKKI